jgi:hypothetical protein
MTSSSRSDIIPSLTLFASVFLVILTISINCVHGINNNKFFADNGDGQTVAYNFLQESQRRNLQQDILDAFGLHRRPHPKLNEKDDGAPKFLIDMYQNILDEESGFVKKEFDQQIQGTDHVQVGDEALDVTSLRAINSSDKIISFSTTSSRDQRNHHRNLMFDVTKVTQDERLMAAELRMFRDVSQSILPTNLTYDITIYQVSRTHELGGDFVRKERTLKKLHSRKVNINHHGWIAFNVTKAVKKWLNNTQSNRGLVVRVRNKGFGECYILQITKKREVLKQQESQS